MKHIYIYITIFIAAITFVSCGDYLDVEPQGKVIPRTPQEYEVIIQQQLLYIETGFDGHVLGDVAQLVKLEFYTDNYDASLSFNQDARNGNIPSVGYDINTSQSDYPGYYSIIKDCNVIIGDMPDDETELSKKVFGVASAIKGVCLYNLLKRYSDPYDPATATEKLGVPIPDVFDIEAKLPRATQKETADAIIEAFTESLKCNVTDENYLFTTDVVEAFLAKTYFWIQDWDNAIKYAEKVLTKIPIADREEYEKMLDSDFRDIKTSNAIIRSLTKIDDMSIMDLADAKYTSAFRPVSKSFVDLFAVDKSSDIRYKTSFGKEGDKIRINKKIIATSVRSEEMCLILAEAHAHKNNNTEALRYLNMLRSNRITPYTNLTEETLPPVYEELITVDAEGKPLTKLMSAILCERRKELFMEGDRWFELKRNGRPEFWVGFGGRKYTTEKYLYTFPIYKRDVDFSDGLIVQNEGYIY